MLSDWTKTIIFTFWWTLYMGCLSNFAWLYYSLSFTCPYHFQWLWSYFKVTAVANSFTWKFYVHIWLSWNFVGLLSTSSRLWIYHYFWLSHIFKEDNWGIFWSDKNFNVSFFMDTVYSFKLCLFITLLSVFAWLLPCLV